MFGMPVVLPPARLTRLAILTLTGATALSVAACGASNNSKPANCGKSDKLGCDVVRRQRPRTARAGSAG